MTVRKLLTTSGFLALTLFLMAFQTEPANEGIPWLVWILILVVALGLFWLAWGRRDVDAFEVNHHDDHSHDGHDHSSHDHAHDEAMVTPVIAVDTGGDVHAAVMPMEVDTSVAEPASVEPISADAPTADSSATMTDATLTSVESSEPEPPDMASPNAGVDDTAGESFDTPTLPPVEIPDEDTPATSMSATAEVPDVDLTGSSQEDIALADVSHSTPDIDVPEGDLPEASTVADDPSPEVSASTSGIGMRDRPRTFPKVEIPDTSPAAEGSVRDTMEFRFGEDNPGEVVQRPHTGESYEPTPMGGGGMDMEAVATPELDVPDLGMPALDDATVDLDEPDTEAVATLGTADMEAELYEDDSASVAADADGTPGWFIGATPTASTPSAASDPAPEGEWEEATLEPPNTAVGSATLPEITLPGYDADLSGAPKWLVTGEDDDADDDLQIIEGIGPKIASILNTSGIRSFRRLAGTSVENLREILDKAGISHIADPGTWAEQAQHAAEGAMDKLQELQARLKGGRKEE